MELGFLGVEVLILLQIAYLRMTVSARAYSSNTLTADLSDHLRQKKHIFNGMQIVLYCMAAMGVLALIGRYTLLPYRWLPQTAVHYDAFVYAFSMEVALTSLLSTMVIALGGSALVSAVLNMQGSSLGMGYTPNGFAQVPLWRLTIGLGSCLMPVWIQLPLFVVGLLLGGALPLVFLGVSLFTRIWGRLLYR